MGQIYKDTSRNYNVKQKQPNTRVHTILYGFNYSGSKISLLIEIRITAIFLEEDYYERGF